MSNVIYLLYSLIDFTRAANVFLTQQSHQISRAWLLVVGFAAPYTTTLRSSPKVAALVWGTANPTALQPTAYQTAIAS